MRLPNINLRQDFIVNMTKLIKVDELIDLPAENDPTNVPLNIDQSVDVAVKVSSLRKSYGEAESKTDALIGLDLSVNRGEIFGVLGPNGAGKTTLIEILEGLRSASAGSARVLGVNVEDDDAMKSLRYKLGVSMQHSVLPPDLTIVELLDFIMALYPDPKDPVELIEMLGLSEKKNSRFRSLSGGQQQRVAISLALVGNPELMFLDEPTSQLDPQARRVVWNILLDERSNKGTTIVVTTHQMEEAERLCDRVLILDHGKILALGTPKELVDEHCPKKSIEFIMSQMTDLDMLDIPNIDIRKVRDNRIEVKLRPDNVDEALLKIIEAKKDNRLSFNGLRIKEQTLEDVFLKLTGRRIRG